MKRAQRLGVGLGVLLSVFACRTQDQQNASEVLDGTSNGSMAPIEPADSFKLTEEKLFDGRVHELHIHVHGDTWNKMITHTNNGGYACGDGSPYGHIKELKFINKNTGDVTILNNAGIRVKGNTSCDDPTEQKGFRIKTNPVDKFVFDANNKELWRFPKVYEEWGKPLNYPADLTKKIKDQHFMGLTTFGLRRGGNDPTRMRDSIASEVFEYSGELARKKNIAGAPERGGPVYRASMIWVRIHNGLGTILEGHYGITELVDEDMVASHYGKKAVSHVFKINEGKGSFLDSDMSSNRDRLFAYYEPKAIDGEGFTDSEEIYVKQKLCSQGKYEQKKCDKLNDEWKKAEDVLRGFKKLLNEATVSPDANTRRQKLDAFMDIDNILSYMVAVNLTGHWDSLVGSMSNNDYLFHNKKNDKWGILTWDLDNTFGAGAQNYPWMASYVEFGVPMKYRPIFKAVLDNYKNEYKARVTEFLEGGFDFDRIGGKITQVRDSVAPNSTDDQYQNLYRFKNHRWGNAWCSLKNGEQSKVKINYGWPEVYKQNGKYVANCH